METYDIVMLVVFASAGIYGAIKGFAWQVASIASIVVSYVVAYRYREPLSQSIEAQAPWNRFLAMLILFVGTSLVIWVAFNMVKKTIDRMKLKEFDRQIGALFGLLKGALYCTLITLFAVTLMGETVRQSIVASKSGRFIARTLDRSESVIPPEIHDLIRPYLDKLDAEFDSSNSTAQADSSDVIGTAVEALPKNANGVPYWQQTLSGAWQNSQPQQGTPANPAGFSTQPSGASVGIVGGSNPQFSTPPWSPSQGLSTAPTSVPNSIPNNGVFPRPSTASGFGTQTR